MTQNFLQHKKLEKKYEKSSLPKNERERKQSEEQAQHRMTNILKKMHAPHNFNAPTQYPPGMRPDTMELRGGRDRVSRHSSLKNPNPDLNGISQWSADSPTSPQRLHKLT